MHKSQTIERTFIGFLVGGVMGYGLSYLILFITNTLSEWLKREPAQVTWKSGLPLAILMVLAMAINMAHPPFGD